MMSRGKISPVVLRRKPLSMTCDISVLMAITSPRLALAGTLISARAITSPRGHAPSVMRTLTRSDQNEPSDNSAIATTVCVSASRMRVDTFARPTRGTSCMLITFGCGFLFGEDVDRLDVVGFGHRAIDRDRTGNRIAVLDQRRNVELHPAGIDLGSPGHAGDRGLHRGRRRIDGAH